MIGIRDLRKLQRLRTILERGPLFCETPKMALPFVYYDNCLILYNYLYYCIISVHSRWNIVFHACVSISCL